MGAAVGGEDGDQRLPDQQLLRNDADALARFRIEAAVIAAVAVVPHDEHASFADFIDAGEILFRQADVEHGVADAAGQRFDIARVAAETLAADDAFIGDIVAWMRQILLRGGDHIVGNRDDQIGDAAAGDFDAVDPHHAIDHLDAIPRQADDALDIIDIVDRMFEHHDIAALGHAGEDAAGDQRPAERQAVPRPAIGRLVDDQIIANQQARLHRFRGDVEAGDHEAADDQHDQREFEQEFAEVDQFPLHVDGGVCRHIGGLGRSRFGGHRGRFGHWRRFATCGRYGQVLRFTRPVAWRVRAGWLGAASPFRRSIDAIDRSRLDRHRGTAPRDHHPRSDRDAG